MTRALPFTQRGVVRAIKAAVATGHYVVGVKPDGTVILSDKPADHGSKVPAELEKSPFGASWDDV